MVCRYFINELCYSGPPSSTIRVSDGKQAVGSRRICETSKFVFCPKFNAHVSVSNMTLESGGSSESKPAGARRRERKAAV